jgi:hypothetical protein
LFQRGDDGRIVRGDRLLQRILESEHAHL